MQIKLKDETILDCINVTGRDEYYQGANRDILEFHFSPVDYTFSQLDDLFADESKTKKIIIIDDEAENLHEHYVIRKGLSLQQVETVKETPQAPAQYEQRLIVSMAQLTHTERQQNTLAESNRLLGQQVVNLELMVLNQMQGQGGSA